jgi:hypothetical protein
LPELAQELHTHLRGRVKGYLFETNHRAAFLPRRIQPLVMAAIANDKDHSILWWGDIVVVVAGSDGRHSAWLCGWGVSRVVTQEITDTL